MMLISRTLTEPPTPRCMFWHTDEDLFGVETTLHNASLFFDKTIEAFQDGKISRSDLQLLEDSLEQVYVSLFLYNDEYI